MCAVSVPCPTLLRWMGGVGLQCVTRRRLLTPFRAKGCVRC